MLRDSWNPADSEPQPRASHSRSSPCPCLVLAPPLLFSASQHIFQSPTLRLRPSSRVWYTQLGVKAAALFRISETRATNTAVATSFWTVISDCQLTASLYLQKTQGLSQLQHIEIGLEMEAASIWCYEWLEDITVHSQSQLQRCFWSSKWEFCEVDRIP